MRRQTLVFKESGDQQTVSTGDDEYNFTLIMTYEQERSRLGKHYTATSMVLSTRLYVPYEDGFGPNQTISAQARELLFSLVTMLTTIEHDYSSC